MNKTKKIADENNVTELTCLSTKAKAFSVCYIIDYIK